MADNVAALVRLMLVTDDRLAAGAATRRRWRARRSAGGVTSVQLRLKRATRPGAGRSWRARWWRRSGFRCWSTTGRTWRSPPAPRACTSVPTICRSALARRIAPPGFVIGASVGSRGRGAGAGAADYWGIGPWRATPTKAGCGRRRSAPMASARLVRLAGGRPCLAIGAVRPEDVPRCSAAGGSGVAVVSGILGGGRGGAARRSEAGARARRLIVATASAPLPRRIPRDRPQVLGVGPAEHVAAVRSGHEVQIGHLGGVERRLDAAPAG